MKRDFRLLMSVIAVLSSMSLSAQSQRDTVVAGEDFRYEGRWPQGEGVLYSHKAGLVFGTFRKGVPDGRCVCYKPNGEVYWGDFRKGKQTGYGKLYRDRYIVFSGRFKNGAYHGIDTLYRENGSVLIGKFRRGKLLKRIHEYEAASEAKPGPKPLHPRINFTPPQHAFIEKLDNIWHERNERILARFKKPKFQGGELQDFAFWVTSQIQYPVPIRTFESEGIVLVQFTIKEDGTLTDVQVIQGVQADLDKEVARVVKNSPQWTPAIHDGKPASVRLTMPVAFLQYR